MYQKIRFIAYQNGVKLTTGGLVIEARKLARMTISEVSRLFPASESPKMHRLEISPEYPTQFDAFNHDFDKAKEG